MELNDVHRPSSQARQGLLRRAMETDDQDNEKSSSVRTAGMPGLGGL